MGNNHTKVNRKKDNRKKSSRKVIKYKRRPKAAAFIFAIILIYVVGFTLQNQKSEHMRLIWVL